MNERVEQYHGTATPETDAKAVMFESGIPGAELVEHARALEIQRNEARAQLRQIQTEHVFMTSSIERWKNAEKQARDENAALKSSICCLLAMADAVGKQWPMLAPKTWSASPPHEPKP